MRVLSLGVNSKNWGAGKLKVYLLLFVDRVWVGLTRVTGEIKGGLGSGVGLVGFLGQLGFGFGL